MTDPTPSRLARLHQRLAEFNTFLLLPMFTVMILEAVYRDERSHFAQLQWFFCAMFFTEWLVGFLSATSRREFALRPTNIADLVSSLPLDVMFQSLRALRLVRVLRVMRIAWRAKRFRGKKGPLVRALGMTISTVFAGAFAIRIVEPAVVPKISDAVWWAVVTVSTVGYGDVAPVSDAGRIVGGVMIVSGIAIYGFFVGFITSVLDDDENDKVLAALSRIEKRLDGLEQTESGVDRPGTNEALDGVAGAENS